MAVGFESTVGDFLHTEENTIIGALTKSVAETGVANQHSDQISAWSKAIELLKSALRDVTRNIQDAGSWHLLLEYEIPRRQKRPDAVILAYDVILVIEFKVGAISHDAVARWQVEGYAFDLRDFHEESAGRAIVPIVCATDAPDRTDGNAMACTESIHHVRLTNRDRMAETITRAYRTAHGTNVPAINAGAWINSRYRPTLTIIEAAERLYDDHDVREISHSYAENLAATTDMLSELIVEAQTKKSRIICFVTGVPGAGNTLTGLNVVHDPAIRSKQGRSSVFLSGNGPLVKVVREALVQNQMRIGRRRQQCEHEVSAFIQNVHAFLRHHTERPDDPPHEHVVVFDEAQRAWNRAQTKRKRGIDASEPELLLEVMERLQDWAVVIALVGGGQEIFLGEAGLEEWGHALSCAKKRWTVVASPEVLLGGSSVAGHRLFACGVPQSVTFRERDVAHLKVSVRSHRAQEIAEWVNDVLEPDSVSAAKKIPDSRDFPLYVSRNLDCVRDWLRARSGGDAFGRCGLVVTSEDQRFRAHGLENATSFRQNYPFDKWFFSPPGDIRSSYALEVSASEFECQGLELDWVGVGWGGDLTLRQDVFGWDYRRFRGQAGTNAIPRRNRPTSETGIAFC